MQTFGDYLSSYEKGKEQAHLPTAAEVRRQFPNPCGHSTGMEDGAILGGAMLSVLCDRFEATKGETLRTKAAQVFAGLRRCVTAARGDFERGEVRRPRQCRKLLCVPLV
ncbi:MAG: hypothetical protein JNM65_01450 [Verrucomicrobiaceae bacterium]|nr:hypothetical protein [Verrucomicrobiaceae bacterium]